MKHIHTFESFLNEATNSRYDIYKKPIDWKENPTSNGSYIAKVKNSTLEIISKGYGSWMLKVDGKLVMPTETAKEKTAKDNHTSSFNWSDDMVGALKHTAQELFESVVDEAEEFMGYKVGDDFYYIPSTQGETRYYKIMAITKNVIKLQNYDFVRNGPDKKGDKREMQAYIFTAHVNDKTIAKYSRGDLSDY